MTEPRDWYRERTEDQGPDPGGKVLRDYIIRSGNCGLIKVKSKALELCAPEFSQKMPQRDSRVGG